MHPSDLCADWIERILHQHNLLDTAISVTGIETKPIGTGQVADSIHTQVTYSETTDAPASFVTKTSSAKDQNRAAGRSEMNYLREVRFYQEIAPRLPVRVPACHHAEIDSNNTEFVLLLEDLSPARPGDQLRGCSLSEVELAVEQAARIHAPFWGSDELTGTSWLDISGVYWAKFTEMMPIWWEGFLDRYRDRLAAEHIELGQAFTDAIDDYYNALRTIPFTIQHGDFRPDNVLFDALDGKVGMAVLDWQTVILAPGTVDVAYFIGGALSPEARREHEHELLARYHRELAAHGVSDYSFDDLLRDYPIGTFQNFVIGVAAAMLVARSERGDDLFVSMASNALTHAIDHDALQCIRDAASRQVSHA